MKPGKCTFRHLLQTLAGLVAIAGLAPSLLAGERVQVMVELQDPPAVQVWSDALTAAGQSSGRRQAVTATGMHLRRLEDAQQRFAAALLAAPGLEARVIFRLQRVLNGVAVEIEADHLARLSALPGVRRVMRLEPDQLDLYASVPLVNAPQVWTSPGVTGEGVRIGIIDSGVDYLHRGLAGSGVYVGQDYTDAIVPWTGKVVGGYDFAGDKYNASCTDADQAAGICSRTPTPDPDPMDCAGHGTHVAGIAAGTGVTTLGATYLGPYSSSTDFASLQIGPGVAPGAQIYALRVFGCSGSSNLTSLGIDWSVDPNGDADFSDHLDVVNLSLGSSFGQADAASTLAANNAALAGVIVVASAGNSGDVTYITGSPGVAERAISVANSVDGTDRTAGFVVNTPPALAGVKPAGEAQFGAKLGDSGPLTGDLLLADDGSAIPSDACEAIVNAAAMNGKIALVDGGTCSYTVKVKNCQTAGATGVLVAKEMEGWPYTMAGIDASITIPSMLTDLATGSLLKTALGSSTVNVTLTAAYRGIVRAVEPPMVDTLNGSSSRGPAFATSALKPDLAAPGTTIYSLAKGTGSGGLTSSGTSMSCPHITGAMALLRQLHPTWTVEEQKAALLGTATHDLFTNPNAGPPTYGPGRVGTGRADLALTSQATLLAYATDPPGAVSVSFGHPEVTAAWTATRTVQLVNKSASTLNASLQLVTAVDMPGVAFSLPGGPQVEVPGNGSATLVIEAAADPAQMKHSRDASMTATTGGYPRHWLGEEAAYLVVQAAGQPTQRLAVYAAPRPASVMGTAESTVPLTAPTGTFDVHLTGQGVSTGTAFPTDWVSLLSAFELAALSPDDPASTGSAQYLDLRYIGVTSDYAAQVAAGKGVPETSLYFGIATWADWASPNKATVTILFDTNLDGTDDYSLTSTSTGGSSPNDVFIALICKLPSGSCNAVYLNGVSPGVRDTVLLNTNVMVLPIPPGWLGLAAGSSRFNYRVVTAADSTAILTYDPAHPGLSFGGTGYLDTPAGQPLYVDLPGRLIPVEYNRDDYIANDSHGLLLLHHLNAAGARAQVLAVTGACTLGCTATVPADGHVGLPVAFGATVSGTACSGEPTWDWDFGDSSPHAGSPTPTHTYAATGPFEWSMTVTVDGVPCTKHGTIAITALPLGDVNGDGTVNVSDVFYLINSLFAGGPSPIGDGDVNHDGQVNVQDVFYVINYLFAGGPPPV